jgi:hypothetical protein
MKKKMKLSLFNLFKLTVFLLPFASCKKDASLETAGSNSSNAAIQSAVASTGAIAISAVSRTSSDSIYVVGSCAAHHHTDSVALSSLPSSVTSYLEANYPGYTFQKAFTDKDSTGTLAGYVVIINYNGNPVGLKFDSPGSFVKVLEQREGRDLLGGHGFHHGGHFDDRDGLKRDTIAISTLPASIASYYAANYPQDTLVRAVKAADSSIIVLSINSGAYATTFTSTGSFVKRSALPSKPGRATSINEEALPSAALSYLTNTYPNYVFKYAFAIKSNRALAGYAVLIDANATKYAVQFDAAGNFVKAITIR